MAASSRVKLTILPRRTTDRRLQPVTKALLAEGFFASGEKNNLIST
jgi:hypothetical protein